MNQPNNHNHQHHGFDLGKSFNQLLNFGNSRTLEVYQPSGQRLVKLPLTVAVLLGVVALVTQLLVPLVIVVVVLSLLKFRFVLTRETPAPPTYPSTQQPQPYTPPQPQPHNPGEGEQR